MSYIELPHNARMTAASLWEAVEQVCKVVQGPSEGCNPSPEGSDESSLAFQVDSIPRVSLAS
jgi:hypothetical protein